MIESFFRAPGRRKFHADLSDEKARALGRLFLLLTLLRRIRKEDLC